MGIHVVILGLMGVGKSTTAEAVAERLGIACHDSDRDLESVFGETGAELAARHGIDELHRLESAMLLGRLADDRRSVISAAAWVVEDQRCCDALERRAQVAVLHASIQVILDRMATGSHRRSMPERELRTLARRRRPMFDAVSNLDLDATLDTEALVETITAAFA